MKSRAHAFIAVACAVLIAASLIWAWHTRSAARDIENRQSKLAAQNASMKERLAALNAQSTADASTAPTTEKTSSSQNPQTKSETPLERFTKQDAENALRNKRLANDSGFQKAKSAADRVALGIVYGPFSHMAGLTPDQTAKLAEIVQQRDTTKNDISAIQREHPDQKDDPVWQQLRNEASDEAKAAIKSMIGDEGLAQFILYDRQRDAWACTGNIAAGLALADLPMSFEQSQKLAEAMSNASAQFQSGKGMASALSDVDWNAVDAEAKKILTPEQFELFSTTDFFYGAGLNGGTASRWNAEFSNALNDALKPEGK